MRKRGFYFIALVAVGVFSLTANGLSTSESHWTVVSQPARLVNGSPVVFTVRAPKTVGSLSGSWLGHEIEFTFDATHRTWFALAGSSLETKAGSYVLHLHGRTRSATSSPNSTGTPSEGSAGEVISFEKAILVGHQRYARVALKVPPRFTAPSPEDQHEIEQDKEIKAAAFKTVSAEREWNGSFAYPVDADISDLFGVERVFNGTVESTHQGLDFRVPGGTPVEAVNSGQIILARPLFFEGNCVVIDHGQGLLTLYLHLSKFLVKEGDAVRKGQEIGLSGGTGRATGPHLHLAVRLQGVYLNPQVLLKLKLP
jgi:murein DD-endopeptidase MepM/ murein hydrolase activator NlpD